MNKQTV
jgi:serine/threonine-protein phosphatase PP1 catalytic subunit